MFFATIFFNVTDSTDGRCHSHATAKLWWLNEQGNQIPCLRVIYKYLWLKEGRDRAKLEVHWGKTWSWPGTTVSSREFDLPPYVTQDTQSFPHFRVKKLTVFTKPVSWNGPQINTQHRPEQIPENNRIKNCFSDSTTFLLFSFVSPCIHICMYPSIYLFICPSNHLSMHSSMYPSIIHLWGQWTEKDMPSSTSYCIAVSQYAYF